jgi:hypothetical protein
MKARVLALYLPQFHPIKENDTWWGKGFTEWTNVGKAKKMFPGHYQPRVPADLGYYDLRLPEVRQAQAEMAQKHGVEGFLYWHYWFGNGQKIMERPFSEVLRSGTPDFPFALAWANATWKGFNYGVRGRNVLLEQLYPGADDYINHFYSVLTAFKDRRYVIVNGKQFFLIFQPFDIPNPKEFIDLWQKLAHENGLNGIHFVAQTDQIERIDELRNMGFDAVNIVRLFKPFTKQYLPTKILKRFFGKFFDISLNIKLYKKCFASWVGDEDVREDCYPCIIPNWDHTPRSGRRGSIIHGSTPKLFEEHCNQIFKKIKNKKSNNKIVILKSWNEWAEGNYIEPDLLHGKNYLLSLQRALKDD